MKRSTQVALLLMGVTGVGATGYTMTRPPPDCVPRGAAIAPPPGKEFCPERRAWGSSSGYTSSSRSSWTRTNNTSRSSTWPVFSRSSTSAAQVPLTSRSAPTTTTRSSTSTTTTSRSAPTTTTRSGFGSSSSSYSSYGS